MPTFINQPTRIEAAGNKPKLIDEYVGRINSKHQGVSIAHMRSPGGWVEPGQTPEFEEFTIVLDGMSSNIFSGASGMTNALPNFDSNNGSFTIENDRYFTNPHHRHCLLHQ